jgi:hypothetical protein
MTAVSVKMSRLEYGEEGYTFYRDEPGAPPEIVIENVPDNWYVNGTLTLNIAMGVKKDASEASGYKVTRHPLKLYQPVDRKYNKKTTKRPGYENYFQVQRQRNATGYYSIKLCKGMDISNHYKMLFDGKSLPDLFLVCEPVVSLVYPKPAIESGRFVVMSKRQPDVIAANRDPEAAAVIHKNGEKRMKRTEQIKALVSSNKQLVAQYKAQKIELENSQRENGRMVALLHQLNEMARLGQSTQSTDVLACFRICLGTTDTMHWMKKRAAPEDNEVSKKRRL